LSHSSKTRISKTRYSKFSRRRWWIAFDRR